VYIKSLRLTWIEHVESMEIERILKSLKQGEILVTRKETKEQMDSRRRRGFNENEDRMTEGVDTAEKCIEGICAR
jgi:hypothetical protein